MIKLDNITKSYNNRTIIHSLYCEIKSGLYILKGESGCGKSTLLDIIRGYTFPDEGKVIIDGIDLYSLKDKERYDFIFDNFSYAGQKPSLIYEESLKSNLILASIYDQQKLDKYASKFKFVNFIDTKINELSGGERAKAEIIFALLKDVKYYFFDETFASLDKDSRQILCDIICDLAKEKTIFLINHDIDITFVDVSGEIIFGDEIIFNKIKDSDDKKGPIKIERKRKNLLAFIHSFLSYSYFDSVFQGILIAIVLIVFSFGMSNINTNSFTENKLVSLKVDPFNYQRVIVSQEETIPYSIFTKRDFEIYVLNKNEVNYYITNCLDDEKAYYYSSEDLSELYTSEKEEIHLEKLTNTSLIPNVYNFQKIVDGYSSDSIIFLPSDTIDSLLKKEHELTFYTKDNTRLELSYAPLLLSGSHINYGSNIIYDQNDLIINDEEGYYFSVSGIKANTEIEIIDSSGYLVTSITTTADGESGITMSVDTYKEFILHAIGNKFYPVYNRNILSQRDVLDYFSPIDTIYQKDNDNETGITYIVVSSVLFLASLLYILLSNSSRKNHARRLKSASYSFGFNSKKLLLSKTIASTILSIIPIILAFLLYLVLFIPLGNNNLVIKDNPMADLNKPYAQIDNPYYDNIKPLQFLHFEPLYLLMFIYILLYILITVYLNKRNMKLK